MNPEERILSGIQTASATIRRVALEWNAGDIPHLAAIPAQLEVSLGLLGTALQDAERIPSLRAAEIRDAAWVLKSEASSLERLVDAAAAFVRSAPAFPVETGDGYGFSGTQLRPSPGGLQGFRG